MRNSFSAFTIGVLLLSSCSAKVEPTSPDVSDPTPVDSTEQQQEELPPVEEEPNYLEIFSELYWEDQFNGESLDESVWRIEDMDAANREIQCYHHGSHNVKVDEEPLSGNRCLVITAMRDTCEHGCFISSGRVSTTAGSWQQWTSTTYGRIDASMMIPPVQSGLWPAFWMMGVSYGNDVPWPRCGELDVMEMGSAKSLANNEADRRVGGAIHYWDPKWNYISWTKSKVQDYSLQDGQFHLFTFIWTKGKLVFYVDVDKYPNAEPYCTLVLSDYNNPDEFNHPFFLIFNLAVGGLYTEIFDASDVTALEMEGGSASMYVDYVRIYHSKDESYHHPDSID